MNEILSFWAQWLRPSAGLPTVQWSLLLAVATVAGYVCQRHIGLPKVVGYSLVGTVAGLAGFSGVLWPLQGIGLFLLELGLSLILFECGGRIPLRWFRNNPMVLVQSVLESALTFFAVYWVLLWLGVPERAAGPLAVVAMAASPAVLTRVVSDTRAAGPVTERSIVLATLSTLYALTLGSAHAERISDGALNFMDTVYPVMVVLGVSVVVAAVLALIGVRLLAKVVGVALGNVGSGASWRQSLWVGAAMTPMSSIALLLASQFAIGSPSTGQLIASVALPAILLMEVLGAVIATLAIYRAGESSRPLAPLIAPATTGPAGDRRAP